MNKLTDHQRNTLKLIQRSLKPGEEWAKVSDICWPLVTEMTMELVELRHDDRGKFVRLTPEGAALMEWAKKGAEL